MPFSKKTFTPIFVSLLIFLYVTRGFCLSIEEEKVFGQKFLAQVYRYFDLVDDPFCRKYINDLGHYLIASLPSRPFQFHFYIIKDKSLNAFAAPGGHIFVFSGLINAVERVDELASVMCHETGHVYARHISERLSQNKRLGMMTIAGLILGIFVGGEAGSALISGSMAASMQAQLHYSRNDERQADQIGFDLLSKSGFDAHATIEVMKRLEKGNLFGTGKIPPYLLTHPTGPERIANLQSMLSSYREPPPPKEVLYFRALFPYFKTIVRAHSLDPDDALEFFEREKKDKPESPLPYLGLGIAYQRRADYESAIKNLEHAHKLRQDFIPIITILADAYESYGQNRKALALLNYAMKLDDDDDSVLFLLGKSYENMAKYDKAIHIFEKLASFQPVRNDVYYNLGICYGREKKFALAHYNFGLYFKNIYNLSKAIFHFNMAEKLAKDNPLLLEKIKRQQCILKGKLPPPRHRMDKDGHTVDSGDHQPGLFPGLYGMWQ